MALTGTSAASAFTVGATKLKLTSATGIANKQLIKVDDEVMRVTDVSLSPTIQVVPGYLGTVSASHNALAPVAYGAPGDFSVPGTGPALVSYGVSGAIAVPVRDTLAIITKATAAAMTLAAPGIDLNGVLLQITSNSAAAHTVTATGLIQDGSTTTDVATFAANAGATVTFKAVAGKWNTVAQIGITFS